jgi:DNA-binding CsgD family transcriptional regulator
MASRTIIVCGQDWQCGDASCDEVQNDARNQIRDGKKNKQIADQFSISETTVNFHIRNIVDKLQASDRTHAVALALRRGLFEV